MKIIHKSVAELTPVEYRACYRANYGDSGYMQGMLSNVRAGGGEGQVILLWDGPENLTKSLIGWVLLTPVSRRGIAAVTRYTMTKSKYTAQFWVKRQYRRKGYSKTLMAEVKKFDPRPHVIPHDRPSAELFSSYDVTVLREDHGWLRRKPKVA